jgi:poly(A) polymerase
MPEFTAHAHEVSSLPLTESSIPPTHPDSLARHAPEIDPAKFDPEALKVVLRLKRHGYQAYFVGGCVRDLLLGRAPKDFDVATSAHPAEVKALFSNCRLIGRRFRLAHVYFKGGKIIEVSTFRANPGEADELAAPAETSPPQAETAEEGTEVVEEMGGDLLITEDNVFGTAEQDARRRDFTVNGLFYDVALGEVIDYVQGRADLRASLIRTIGDPEVRMREDPVRILRAVRLASKLHFDIESGTYAAMEGSVEDLPRCAPARLLEETFRMLRAAVAGPGLRLLNALGALKLLLPPVHDYLVAGRKSAEDIFYAHADALDHVLTRNATDNGPVDDAVLLAALLVPVSRATDSKEPDKRGRPSVVPAVEELLRQLTHAARLPKRIAQRCKMILAAQPTLSGERRRRGGLSRFRRYPLFHEALTVFEITVEATGQHQKELEIWKSGAVPAHSAETAHPPRRRRRRRRRRGQIPSPSGRGLG